MQQPWLPWLEVLGFDAVLSAFLIGLAVLALRERRRRRRRRRAESEAVWALIQTKHDEHDYLAPGVSTDERARRRLEGERRIEEAWKELWTARGRR